jgi:hypothetical protein
LRSRWRRSCSPAPCPRAGRARLDRRPLSTWTSERARGSRQSPRGHSLDPERSSNGGSLHDTMPLGSGTVNGHSCESVRFIGPAVDAELRCCTVAPRPSTGAAPIHRSNSSE